MQFPDVFVYPVSRQEMQMSSFYDQTLTPATPRLHLKSVQKNPEQCAVQISGRDTTKSSLGSIYPSNHQIQRHTANSPAESTQSVESILPVETKPLATIPPTRRVVKFSVSPRTVVLGISISLILNTALCLTIPSTITPPLGTQWGSFLYFWLAISTVQLVTHSIYLCTPFARSVSLLNFVIVAFGALLLPRSSFVRCLWIAPCLCTEFLAHQIYLFSLVYLHLDNWWIYVGVGGILVLVPMTQLLQIDSNDGIVMQGSATAWSAISIYSLYAFAIANSRKAAIVDIIIGTSPTTQLQE
jgi:hypothetical protein